MSDKLTIRRGLLPVVVCALPLLMSACSWFTDFKRQPKIDPWETEADTIPFRGNPQSSVPTVGSAAPGFEYDRAQLPGSITAMAGIKNPVPADSASVNRGRILFQINCAPCHGPLGMGNGPATKYGMIPMPIGAGSNAANNLTDGYIFGMIRNGRGMMPTYNRIEESERWDIINYLRSIQGKGTVPPDTIHGLPGMTGQWVPGPTPMGPTVPSPYYKPHATTATQAAPPSASSADTTKAAAKPTTDSTKKPELEP